MDIQNIQERVQFMLDKHQGLTWDYSAELEPREEDKEDEFLYGDKWYPMLHWYNTAKDVSLIVLIKEYPEVSISLDDWEYTSDEVDIERALLACFQRLGDCYGALDPSLNIAL
jgi:hypothetical protein